MFDWRKQTQPGLVLNNPYLGLEGAPDVTVWKLFKSTFMASMAYSTWKSLPSGENVFTPLQGQHRQSEKGRKAMERSPCSGVKVGQQGRVPFSTGHPHGLDLGCSWTGTQGKSAGQGGMPQHTVGAGSLWNPKHPPGAAEVLFYHGIVEVGKVL